MSLISVHMPSSMLGFNDGTPGNNPTVAGVTPANISASGGPVTITLTGTNFVNGSTILVDGVPLTTTFGSATSLTASWDPVTTANALFTVRSPNGEISSPYQYTSVQTLMADPQSAEPQKRTISRPVPDAEPEAMTTSASGPPPKEVVPGDPGHFLPRNSEVPENIAALRDLEVEMETLRRWKAGDYITIGTGNVHWDGEDWVKGIA